MKCAHCPMKDEPGVTCHALTSGASRLCRKVDPSDDLYDPRMPEAVRRLTLEPLGRWVEPQFPTLATRVVNAAGAAVAAVMSGGRRVSPEERERRLSICRGCEHFDAESVRCRQCGCHLNLKVRLDAWHCPLDPPKW